MSNAIGSRSQLSQRSMYWWQSSTGPLWMATDSRKKILVVDDDLALLRFVEILLSPTFHVRTASEGAAALVAASEFGPDLIVLDLRMPGMDGQTVFRELRTRGDSTPVLIFSAFGAEEAYGALNAEGFISKPFLPTRFLSAVEQILEQSH